MGIWVNLVLEHSITCLLVTILCISVEYIPKSRLAEPWGSFHSAVVGMARPFPNQTYQSVLPPAMPHILANSQTLPPFSFSPFW